MSSKVAVRELRSHLKTLGQFSSQFGTPPKGWRYSSIYELVTGEGRAFPQKPLTAAQEAVVRKVLKRYLRHTKPRIRQCYCNASILAEVGQAEGFAYFEGYAAGIIPVNHAWVGFQGKAIDVTWRELEDNRPSSIETVLSRIRENVLKSAYMGIEVPLAYLHKIQLRDRCYSSALDDWGHGFPVLETGFSFKEEKTWKRTAAS